MYVPNAYQISRIAELRDILLSQEYLNIKALEALADEAERAGLKAMAAHMRARVIHYKNQIQLMGGRNA